MTSPEKSLVPRLVVLCVHQPLAVESAIHRSGLAPAQLAMFSHALGPFVASPTNLGRGTAPPAAGSGLRPVAEPHAQASVETQALDFRGGENAHR